MKILCIQTRQLGEVLMITPMLAALKNARPDIEVHVLSDRRCVHLLRNNPNVDRMIPWGEKSAFSVLRKLRREQYDAVIDSMGTVKTAFIGLASGASMRIGFRRPVRSLLYTHPVDFSRTAAYAAHERGRLLGPLGITSPVGLPELFADAPDKDEAARVLARVKAGQGGRIAAFSPVSPSNRKRWPLANFARVCDRVSEKYGFRLLPLFGPGEELFIEEVINASMNPKAFLYPYPAPSFRALLPLMRESCAFYFGNDNGIRHVAIIAGLPTVTVFGRPNPATWTPPSDSRHRTLWGRGRMADITPEQFMDMVEQVLHENALV